MLLRLQMFYFILVALQSSGSAANCAVPSWPYSDGTVASYVKIARSEAELWSMSGGDLFGKSVASHDRCRRRGHRRHVAGAMRRQEHQRTMSEHSQGKRVARAHEEATRGVRTPVAPEQGQHRAADRHRSAP